MAGQMTSQPRMVFVPLFTPEQARKAKSPASDGGGANMGA